MSHCKPCGKMGSVPMGIKFNDTRTGATRMVKTEANLLGKKPVLKDQRGMNQKPLKKPNM